MKLHQSNSGHYSIPQMVARSSFASVHCSCMVMKKKILIFLPFVDQSSQLQLHAISKRFEIEERGWSHLIANLMYFDAFFLLLKSDKYYRKYCL